MDNKEPHFLVPESLLQRIANFISAPTTVGNCEQAILLARDMEALQPFEADAETDISKAKPQAS